jgi:aminopeptidase N
VPSYGIYYRLTIRLDPARGTIRGDVWIATRSSTAVRAERLFAAPTLVIDSILSGRVAATVFRRGDTVTFTPSNAGAGGAGGAGGRSEVVQVFYHGTASPPALSMEPHAGAPAASTYGLPYAARAWWPTPGSTLAKADSADVTITVPGHLTAISNGRLVSRSTSPDRWVTYHWATRHPI